MATAKAILRASKAVPGAGRPTAAPQGGPWIGQLPGYSMQPGDGYAAAYGPFLPRPPQTFTSGAFGPFSPILPVPVDMPPPGERLPEPRREEYRIGWNLPQSPPGSEGLKLASFETLRQLADLYSVARACINLRKSEIRGLDWEITMTRDAEKAYRGDRAAHRDFGERQGEAKRFFMRPDPDYDTLGDFLGDMLEQVFVFDALAIFYQPVRGRGLRRGLLGSDLDCLQLVDGQTIRPLYDLQGGTPRPPAPAWQQFLYGVPRGDFTRVFSGRDLQDAGLTQAEWRPFTRDQMMYRPMERRRWTPYGQPPVERALIPIMTGLARQGWQLDYWREGTVPAVYISPGDAAMTPTQIRELQDALNAFAGDYGWHHKIIVLPPGSKTMPQKDPTLADALDNIVMTQVCMAFDVRPMEIGIMPNVSTLAGSFATREMAAANRTMTQRASAPMVLKFIADIFNGVLQGICGQHDMQFAFAGMADVQDQAATTDLLVKQVQSGLRSADEARDVLELPPWGEGLTGSPVVFTAQGVVPFGAIIQSGPDGKTTTGGGGGSGKDGTTGAHDAARAAITGAPDTRALPPGTVAERQRRRGGRLAPAHSMAEGSPGHSGDKPVGGKAATAELEALARHLRKGRHITTWRPQHVPGHVLALVSEGLTEGLPPDVAVEMAKTVALDATEYAWADADLAKAGGAGPKHRTPSGDRRPRPSAGDVTNRPGVHAVAPGEGLEGHSGHASAADRTHIGDGQFADRGRLAPLGRPVGGVVGVGAKKKVRRADARRVVASVQDKQAIGDWAAFSQFPGDSMGQHGLPAHSGLLNEPEDAVVTPVGISGSGPHPAVPDFGAMPWDRSILADLGPEAFRKAGRGKNHEVSLSKAGTSSGKRKKRKKAPNASANQQAQQQAQAQQAAQQQAAQQQAQALAQQYAARIQAAFTAAMNAAAKLIAAWAAGTLVVTVAVLVAMIVAEVRKRLQRVLNALWRRAWALGQADAESAAGKMAKDAAKEALRAFLATVGEDWAGLISGTRMRQLQEELTEAVRAGTDPQALAEELARILGVAFRVDMIAATEAIRGMNAAAMAVFNALGVAYKVWRLGNRPNHCQVCIDNQNQGPVPLSGLFKSGLACPPQHPNCGCSIFPWMPPSPTASKAARRQVELNGEVVWAETTDPPFNAAGSGASPPRPHITTGNGAQQDIPGGVPGATAGGEPPRWDATAPSPGQRWVNGGDDAAQGGPRGIGTPADAWPSPHYMDGYGGDKWPQGGHGTQQAPMGSAGAGPRGRAPNAVGKAADAAGFLKTAPKARKTAVYNQLRENYPSDSLRWVLRIKWVGPVEVPMTLVDFKGRATWAASHQPGKVDSFVSSLQAGRTVDPAVAIIEPGKAHIRIVDGHHRTLAAEKIGWPIRCWVGYASGRDAKQALEAHASQIHQGSDPQNKAYAGDGALPLGDCDKNPSRQCAKSFTAGAMGIPGNVSGLVPFNLLGGTNAPGGKVSKESVNYRPADAEHFKRRCGTCVMYHMGTCDLVEGKILPAATCDRWEPKAAKSAKGEPHVAGLMLRATDTGRVLMLQRAITEDDPAAGKFEPPGGHAEDGETLPMAAAREWQEEVGCFLPPGTITGSWTSGDGVYRGYVVDIPSESMVDLEHGRDQVQNPDGDSFESAAWFDPAELRSNPSMRPEMTRDLPLVMDALNGVTKSGNAETLREYWAHEAHPGPTHFRYPIEVEWGTPGDFMRCVRQVMEHGKMSEEQAKGYCNLEHHRALGYWPAQHARMVREGKT